MSEETGQQAAADPAAVNRLTRRRQMALLGALVLSALLLSFVLTNMGGLSGPSAGGAGSEVETVNIVTAGSALEDSDLWRGQAEADLLALRRENESLRFALDDLAERLENVVIEPPAEDDLMVRDRLITLQEMQFEEAESEEPAGSSAYAPPASVPYDGPAPAPAPSRGIDFVAAPAPAAPPSSLQQERNDEAAEASPKEALPGSAGRLPAGTFLPALMLGSLDAPTGQSGSSNPLPVLMRIERHAQLPNALRRDVRECFVTGAGFGDISSERAYIRTERMSCVTRSGGVVDVPVKGYVAGEDGRTGVRGALVSRQGQLLARSLFAGVMSGIGDAFHDRHSEIRALDSVGSGEAGAIRAYPEGLGLQAGIARGAAGSLEKLSDYYLALADRMHPVIEIAAGRRVDIVLQEGVDIPDLHAEAGNEADAKAADGLTTRYGKYAGRR